MDGGTGTKYQCCCSPFIFIGLPVLSPDTKDQAGIRAALVVCLKGVSDPLHSADSSADSYDTVLHICMIKVHCTLASRGTHDELDTLTRCTMQMAGEAGDGRPPEVHGVLQDKICRFFADGASN